MPTYSPSAKALLEKIQADPKRAANLKRYSNFFAVARAIREKMDEKDISVRELARLIGTSPSQAQRIISYDNPSNLTMDSFFRAAEAVGLEISIKIGEPGRSPAYVQRGEAPSPKPLWGVGDAANCVADACEPESLVRLKGLVLDPSEKKVYGG